MIMIWWDNNNAFIFSFQSHVTKWSCDINRKRKQILHTIGKIRKPSRKIVEKAKSILLHTNTWPPTFLSWNSHSQLKVKELNQFYLCKIVTCVNAEHSNFTAPSSFINDCFAWANSGIIVLLCLNSLRVPTSTYGVPLHLHVISGTNWSRKWNPVNHLIY